MVAKDPRAASILAFWFGNGDRDTQARRCSSQRFGRFPHRNAILGRESTPQEIEFLMGPGSSF
jgi:uncharacterized protein (DUF924 family)